MASFEHELDEKQTAGHIEHLSTQSGKFAEDRGDAIQDWTPAEERKVVWKVDFRVFPMLCVVFGLSLLDRSNISAAFIAGMDVDLNLTGNRYNIALLVFFIGYGLFELPSNFVIRRIGARWWLSFLIVSWGACVLGMRDRLVISFVLLTGVGMGFVEHWSILAVLRALLGIFEAGAYYTVTTDWLHTHIEPQVYFPAQSSSLDRGIANLRREEESRSSTWLPSWPPVSGQSLLMHCP